MTLLISNLTAGYGQKMVLHNINISNVNSGEFIGLIGPNASGKSTLFKSIAGIIKPAQGMIQLDGVDMALSNRTQRAQKIAYMPQSFGCNAALTVFESVLLALKQTTGWRVQKEDIEKVSDTIELLNLSHLSDRNLSMLSGGQSQMVAMAQILVRDPMLILLDEPTSALDLHHQLSILDIVRTVTRKRNITVLLSLHDLNLAAQFCDRIILINEGKVLADGEPVDVLALNEIDETYQVITSLEKTRRSTLFVDARLHA